MAQGLHLSQKMALSQVLAPQLQQSLALLQAPTLELKALVEQELQQNPVLEESPDTEMTQEERETSADGETADSDEAGSEGDAATDSEPEDNFQEEFERLAQVDQDWRDHYADSTPKRPSEEEEERRQYMMDSIVASTSLPEHLLEQVRVSELTDEQRPIAEMIIGNIDDYGYLQASADELAFSTGTLVERIQEVLRVIQSFHPPGVAARNLRECLLLQLDRAEKTETIEYQIVDQHMDLLAKRRIPELSRTLGITVEQVQSALERIANLEPRPGRAFLPDNQQYISPEVFVQRVGDEYVVTNNHDQVPHLRISNTYKDIMSQANSGAEVREYIREKIRAGKFLIKSLHQRQQTILNIGKEIVTRQKEFMDEGVGRLKPMTMSQVAEAVGVHETTVSRAVSGKYIQTPQGVFEMKYFFTSGVRTATGETMSNTSVKDIIQEMVSKESPQKPLSDEEIVKILKTKGIEIARRTVAKYRAELNILPSHLRKVY